MSAREKILGAVRSSLGREGPLSALAISELEKRECLPVQPDIASDLVGRFAEKLEQVGGSVERVESLDEVANAVGGYLKRHQLPNDLVVSTDAVVSSIEWPPLITTKAGPATGQELVSVTGALAAVAEAATLVLVSGEKTPTSLNFLPDDHIVVLSESRVVGHLEDAWAALRSSGDMPRTVNLISGPSKTGDVELTLVQGAHGPRRLHVILFKD